MRRIAIRPSGIRESLLSVLVVTLTAPAIVSSADAEIYRWVDEQGNVHFGDRPVAPEDAARASSVELGTGYTPTSLTTEEREARAREEQAYRKKTEARRNAQEKEERERLAALEDKKARACAADREKLKRITQWETTKNGGRRMYYLTDDDGQPMKVDQHEAAIAALREKIAREC